MLYIPGNHDPKTLFEENKKALTPTSANIHNAFVQLADGLMLLGLGGSVPAFKKTPDSSEEVWSPYPWKDGDLYTKTLSNLYEAAMAKGDS